MTNEPTRETIDTAIVTAFANLYPLVDREAIEVLHPDDEIYDVLIPDGPTFRAIVDSDDDGFLRFYLHDEDYEAEFVHEDPTNFLSIRVKVY